MKSTLNTSLDSNFSIFSTFSLLKNKTLLLVTMVMMLLSYVGWGQIGVTITGNTNTTPNLASSYTSFANFVTALNGVTAVSGPVTATLAAGTSETAPVKGFNISTSTANVFTTTNTLTIVKAAGSPTTINAGVGTSASPSASSDGLMYLSGMDGVTIDGLTFTDGNTASATVAMEFGIALFKRSAGDGCNGNTIQNCTFNMQRISNGGGTVLSDGACAIQVLNSTPSAATTSLTPTNGGTLATNGTNSNNKFYSNTINGGNAGIHLGGFAATSGVGPSPTATTFLGDINNDIGGSTSATGNTITNFGGGASANSAVGIRANNQWSVNIRYNTIDNNNGSGVNHAATLRGIFAQAGTSASATISNNTVTVRCGATTSGLTAIDNGIGSTAASNTININNNIIRFSYTTATTGVFTAINNASTAGTVNIESNNIQQLASTNYPSTGTIVVIEGGSPAGPLNITNNIISNFNLTGTSGTLRAIKATTPTGLYTCTGNTIENLSYATASSTGSIDGIFNSASALSQNWNNNIVRNLSIPGTGTIRGIFNNTLQGTFQINNNQIYNFFTSPGGAGGSTFTGIGSSRNEATISGNIIYALNSTGTTGGTGGQVDGIRVTASSPTASSATSIVGNSIYNLSSNSSNVAVNGINLLGGTNNNVINNLIGDLRATASTQNVAISGILVGGGTTNNIYHNTVNIAATTSSATTFGTSAIYFSSTLPVNNLRNNIFVNTSSSGPTGGFAAAIRYTSAPTSSNFPATNNNNLYFAGTPSATKLIYGEGGASTATNPQQTIANYKTYINTTLPVAGREVASVSEDPLFTQTTGSNPVNNFLKFSTSTALQTESGGIAVSGITTDIAGTTRNSSSPDIGAWELAGIAADLTAPTISYTPLSNACAGTFTLTATITDASGVPTSGSGLPTLYFKINSGSYTAVTGTSIGSNQFTFSFGSAAVASDVISYYIVAQDNASTPNIGSSPSSGASGFTTSPPAASTPPTSPSSFTIITVASLGVTATATATPSNICVGSSSSLSLSLTKPGDVVLGAGASTSSSAGSSFLPGAWGGAKTQYLIKASELTALGLSAGNITSIGFEPTTSGQTYTGFQLWMNTSSLANLTTTFQPLGTQVYLATATNNGFTPTANSVNSLAFGTGTGSSSSFNWDGTSNIILTFSWSSVPNATTSTASTMKVDSPGFTCAAYDQSDNQSPAAELALATADATGTSRPRFTFSGNTAPTPSAYSWSDGTSVVGTTNPLSQSPTSTTTYTGSATVSGCPVTASPITVTANALPSAPSANVGTSTQCGTGIPTVSVSGTSSEMRWYNGNTSGSTLLQTGGLTFASNISTTTTFYVGVNNGTCETAPANRTALTVTVNIPDVITASASSTSIGCLGNSTNISVSQSGSNNVYSLAWTLTSYTGSGLSGSTSATLNTPITVTPTAAATYIYTITGTESSSGCTSTSSVTVTVSDPLAGITASASATPTSICAGSPSSLNLAFTSSSAVPSGYPAPVNTTSSCSSEITSVSINTLSRTSVCESSYYVDVPPSSATTTLYKSQSYTFNVSTANNTPAIVSVWIDWNGNGSFETTEWYQPYTNAITGTVSITVPGTAITGLTKMRVRSRNNGSSNGSSNSATSFGSGECEDYTISVLPQPSAYSWSDGSTVVGSTNPLSVSPTSTTTYTGTATISGCPISATGVQVAIIPGPTAPVDLAATAASTAQTTTTISANFTAAASAPTGYLVVRTNNNTQPSPVNSTNYTVGGSIGSNEIVEFVGTSAGTWTSSGLTGGTTYYYWVFSYNTNVCGGPVYSSSATSFSETTLACPGTSLAGLSYAVNPASYCLSSAITANTATLSVTAGNVTYTVSPSLPTGLTLNASTGQISGTPTVAAAATDYTITANNGCTNTAATLNIATLALPDAPVSSSGTGAATFGFTANWAAAAGATAYLLDVSQSSTFATMVSGYDGLNVGNVLTYSVTGLAAGNTYYYRVRTTNGTCNSVNSSTQTIATTAMTSAATGNWNATSTWTSGQVPTCNDVVSIESGHNVTVNSSSNVSGAVTIASGGTLTIASGDLTVGCTLNNTPLTNNGTLTVTNGTLNVNGNIWSELGSTFNQSGGAINIDGNNGGSATGSVASGTPLLNLLQLNSGINWTGGTLTIVDPHTATTNTNAYSIYYNNSTVGTNYPSPNHTVQFGNGVSTDQGGNASGFYFNQWAGSALLPLGALTVNGPSGTNRGVNFYYTPMFIQGDMIVNSGGLLNGVTDFYFGKNVTVNSGGIFVNTGTLRTGTLTSNTGSGVTAAATTVAQSIGGTGTFSNLATNPTANLTSLIFNNTSSSGVTLSTPLSVSGTLTMTAGKINTTATNLLTLGTSTAAGTLSYAAGQIAGPFARTFAASTTGTTSTFGVGTLFPVGDGTNYLPLYINPVTSAGGPVVFTGQVFNSNSGTGGAGLSSTLGSRRWEALISSGAANLTSCFIQLNDASIASGNQIVQSGSPAGTYNTIIPNSTFTSGTPNTLQTASAINIANYAGYFSYAAPGPVITSFTPTSICPGTSSTITITGTNLGSPSSVTLNGEACTVTNSSSTSITITTDATPQAGSIVVTTPLNTATSPNSLSLYTLPTVTATSDATNNTVCSGTSVILNGGGASSYSWNNGVSNNASFTPISTNSYTVTGTDGNGCVNTASITITVNNAVSISAQPINQVVLPSANATFSVTASGTGLTYQWEENTGSSWSAITNGGIYSGATTNTLTLTAVTSSESGYQYRCVVSGTTPCAAATSSAATLTISTTAISAQPQNQSICSSSGSATFSVTTTGTPPSSYQWQLSTDAGATWADISGATTSSLSLTGLTTAESGYVYQCIINGTITSNAATLTVSPTSVAGNVSADQGICASTTPSSITLSGSTGTIQWQVSTDNSTFSDISGATSSTLAASTIGALTSTRYYRAIVTSGGCTAATSGVVTITVTPTPNAGTLSGTQTICANATTTFSTNGDTGGAWSSLTQATATVNSSTGVVTGVSAGTTTITYTITGTGGCNNATATRTVTVNPVPSITSSTATPATLCAGSTVSLSAASVTLSNGSATAGSGNTTSTSAATNPFYGGYGGVKSQYLIRASDLTAIGLAQGNITSLGFNVTSVGATLSGFGISIGNTSLSSITSTIESVSTNVFSNSSFTPTLGINTINFSSPFTWDGTSNIIVSFCWSNNNTSNSATTLRVYSPGYTTSNARYVDSRTSSEVCSYTGSTTPSGWNGSSTTSSSRPIFTFGGQISTNNAASYTWAWNTTPSVSAATGTTTAVNNTNSAITQTYNVTATIAATGCSTTATTSAVTINPTPATPTANSTSICGPQNATCSVTGSGISGNTFKWYTVPTGGTMITGQTGSSLTAYPISTTTSLYASEANANCESARVEVIQTVTTSPAITASASSATVCAGSSTTLSATSSNTGYTYTWSNSAGSGASVSVSPSATTTYTVSGSDASGGNSNGCMSTASVTVTVNPLPTALTLTPSSAVMCNGLSAAQSLVASGGDIPSAGLTSWSGNGTTLTSSSSYPTIFGNYWYQDWNQFLYTAAELTAMGLQPGNITSMRFKLGALPLPAVDVITNYSVRIAPTSNSSLSAFVSAGLTTVFSSSSFSPSMNNSNIAIINFSTPYFWNGTDNIVIDIRGTGNYGDANATTEYTTTTNNTVVYAYSSSDNSSFWSSNPTPTTSAQRPNVRFNGQILSQGPITWTPTTPSNTLYTDANATTAYTAGTSATTVYALPTATTTYTATATSAAGCTNTATATITVNEPSAAPTGISGTTSICIGASTTLTATGGTLGTGANYEWGTGSVVGTNPIAGQTSATITVTPATTTTYWVRIVNGTAPCTATTAGVSAAVTVDPLNTWIGGNGNWSDPNNWCGGLPTSSSAVVIANNATITLNAGSGVTTQVASMTINNGATLVVATGEQLTLTGALVNNGAMIIETGGTFVQANSGTSVTGNGTYNVQQYLTGSQTNGVLDGRFWYMGVPLNVTRSSSFGTNSSTNRVWSWSETGQAYSVLGDATTLVPTTGLVVRRDANGTVNFNGSGATSTGLYAQDATLTGLTKTGAFYSGYHLLANPYTAYLDFEMMDAGSNNMSSTIWTRAAIGSSATMVFDTYNAASNLGANPSGGSSNQYIAPMQAFWVRVAGNTGTTGNISMTRAMTSHNSSYGGLKSSAEYPAFARVNVVDGNKSDQALVYLRSDLNNGVDAYDSEKMFATGIVQIYTTASGKKLVMNGLKNNKKRISVPLNLDIPASKVYELNLSEFNMENGVILLEDKQEGIIQDFTIHDHYAFYASSGTLNNRFVLHFYMPEVFNEYQAPSNSWANEEPTAGGVFIGSDSRGKVLIELDVPSELQKDHVQVLNSAGQIIYEADLDGAQTEFELNEATGIYLVRVTNGSTVEVKKIIIQH